MYWRIPVSYNYTCMHEYIFIFVVFSSLELQNFDIKYRRKFYKSY
jgi:hypothetical protein